MIKHVIRNLTPAVVMAALSLSVLVAPVAFGFDGTAQGGADAARGTDQTANLFGQSGIFRTITNVLLFVLGAISVIMIIIGGLRYVISGGNSTAVTAAKNTILYAIVGVIVALLAYAIINFVLDSFTGGTSNGTNV
ncbi:MAG TPA: hypothetical protein PK096_01450 [Candidatus Saccharibacteria bacterium]|nr:hypothetical protein [Candidatus Saccharibacteria bacterium]HRK94014.1 hypothetical protein [Candidatus Saccharibacteria bacterium]